MNGFDSRFIEELKTKCDIVEVVSKYVRLEQRGGSFWGKCPFHHEKTPSFAVNTMGQYFYCFGCGKSGDVISFVMDIESLDFGDAVRFLAERANMKLPEVKYDDEKVKEQKKFKQRLLDILRETALFYVRNLRNPAGAKHFEYIKSRGITVDTAVKFGMGASLDFKELPAYLKDKGYTYSEMVASGAVGEKDGRYFDWLGGRLTIPVIDQFNNVVAFAGRRIDGGKEQKYINTKETYVFVKGKTFFNLNNLKKLKNEKGLDSVIMVEGHLDVVSLTQAGFKNVVAGMGTALTKDQARILKRYTDKVYISYDGDFAGQKASLRGLEILNESGLELKVVALPDGLDPDDVIKKFGKEGYQKLLDDAKPLIDFKLDMLSKTFDIKAIDGKRKFVSGAIKIIRESSSSAEQDDLLKMVRNLTGTSFESLKRELLSVEETKEEERQTVTPEFKDNVGDKNVIAARFVLSGYLFGKPYAKETDINGIEFELPAHKEIKQYILDRVKTGGVVRFNDLYEIIAESDIDEVARIAGLETEENKKFDQATYFFDCVRALKLDKINREIDRVNKLFEGETDLDKRKVLTKELMELISQKKHLSK